MIDLTKVPKEELYLAEKFAYEYHYPDSVAKGIKNKKTGEYIEEAEITMKIFLAGLNAGKNFAEPVLVGDSEQLVCDKCVEGLSKSKSFKKGTCVHCRKEIEQTNCH